MDGNTDDFKVALARLDERLNALRQVAEGVKFTAEQVHRNAERITVHDARFEEVTRDIGQLEGRMERAVQRVEKSCNDLGELLRQMSGTVATVQAEQTKQAQVATARTNGLYALAGILVTGALGLAAKLLGLA